MKLATVPNGRRDGQLVVVSRGLDRCLVADGIAATLQEAIERWSEVEAPLRRLSQRVEAGEGEAFDPSAALAPLPRAWQWLDGSAYLSHGELMQTAFKHDPLPRERPLMYQGMSDTFHAPTEDVPLPSEADGIDFEGEFGIVTDEVPMGVSADEALAHIKLIVQINDWSLRVIAPIEMKTGFGWVQAKPACSMAPVAVTPDELGDRWRDGRVDLPLQVWWNGEKFGEAQGYPMAFGFHELVAHAAHSRRLAAGTVIGSGTVSNANYREVGSCCIAERRAIEMIDKGSAQTPFMSFGDRVRMEVRNTDGALVFGAIDQKVTAVERCS
jgi:fumarylacetoacetate (FAA) hydrolase